MTDLERAKQRLREKLESMPHTQYDLLGNAACSRIVRALIMAYVSEGATLSTCKDEVKTLMFDSGFSDKSFDNEIMPEIAVYYKAEELIDNGKSNYHKG